VPFFWVITAAEGGNADARVVNAQPSLDDWARWFLTPRTGRKAMEMATTVGLCLATSTIRETPM
jgi:hypothetical protein